ncbi:MAG: hypothetical protein AAFV93_22540 [Chloroflexota bacterium]
MSLRAAVPDSFPELEPNDISAIAGEPVILVERLEGDVPQIDETPVVQAEEVSSIVTVPPPTPGPIFNPTVAPEDDDIAPTTFFDELPEISTSTFFVSWGADDNGTIERYVVWVQINDGAWTPWLETQRTEGIYTGTSGNSYQFAVWAVDTGGNWSTNTDLQPQAQTRVE